MQDGQHFEPVDEILELTIQTKATEWNVSCGAVSFSIFRFFFAFSFGFEQVGVNRYKRVLWDWITVKIFTACSRSF